MLREEVVERVVADVGAACRVAIHAHNDGGCAVANSLVAVAKGADWCKAPSTATESAAATPT